VDAERETCDLGIMSYESLLAAFRKKPPGETSSLLIKTYQARASQIGH